MQREPGKLNQVELGLWALGQVGDQVGLNNYHRAFAFRHRVKGRLEFLRAFRAAAESRPPLPLLAASALTLRFARLPRICASDWNGPIIASLPW